MYRECCSSLVGKRKQSLTGKHKQSLTPAMLLSTVLSSYLCSSEKVILLSVVAKGLKEVLAKAMPDKPIVQRGHALTPARRLST